MATAIEILYVLLEKTVCENCEAVWTRVNSIHSIDRVWWNRLKCVRQRHQYVPNAYAYRLGQN